MLASRVKNKVLKCTHSEYMTKLMPSNGEQLQGIYAVSNYRDVPKAKDDNGHCNKLYNRINFLSAHLTKTMNTPHISQPPALKGRIIVKFSEGYDPRIPTHLVTRGHDWAGGSRCRGPRAKWWGYWRSSSHEESRMLGMVGTSGQKCSL